MTTDRPKRKKHKIIAICLCVFFISYVSSYCILSALGTYCAAKSGNYRLNTGMAFFDIYIWTPRIGYAKLYRKSNGITTIHMDWVGLFYCPLILLDHKYVHKIRPIRIAPTKAESGTRKWD